MLPCFVFGLIWPPDALPSPPANLPVVVVSADDTVIDRDCLVRIGAGVIADANADGVIHIVKPCTVWFEPGAALRGAAKLARPDTYSGIAIRVTSPGVMLMGDAAAPLRIEAFKVGVLAEGADNFVLAHVAFDDLWRQRLLSTPDAEDAADWLWPHENDKHQWRMNYGAAASIEQSRHVTVRDCSVRHGQNGLILDRVSDAKVFDNDFSFLSGWGLAMWRSSDNLISRNALDFCIRGYSHGVYNRGQDSAGILCFEQCNRNTFVENSATHGGDGFFAFAGKEALGDNPPPGGGAFDCSGKGCNDNLFVRNDFSDAAAHGLELTFSFGNLIQSNRLSGNGICGIWGGYSQRTVILNNTIQENGPTGRRAGEGGGVNIEHGWDNLIIGNRFAANSRAIALWWDDDGTLLKGPWAQANHKGSGQSIVARNRFEREDICLYLRKTTGVVARENDFQGSKEWIDKDDPSTVNDGGALGEFRASEARAIGEREPVGSRDALRGRQHIVMTEWGPWDHASPLVRLGRREGASKQYELFHTPLDIAAVCEGEGVTCAVLKPESPGLPTRVNVSAAGPGLFPYTLRLTTPDRSFSRVLTGTILACTWDVRFFAWKTDPRQDLLGWRQEGAGPGAVACKIASLALRFGNGGPSQLNLAPEVRGAKLPTDHFGTIATTSLPLPPGRYRITTLSDDGVRVTARVGGGLAPGQPGAAEQLVIENWAWHGPTTDEGWLVVPGAGKSPHMVDLTVEHFELDGYAVLECRLEPAGVGKP